MPSETTAVSMTIRDKIVAAVLASGKPITFKQLKTQLKKHGLPTTGKGKVADDVLREELRAAVQSGQVHEHPGKLPGDPLFSREKYRTPLEIELDKVRATFEAAYADLGADAVPAKKLGLPGAKAKPEAHQAFQQILNEYLQAGKLHAHPGDKYGKQAPKDPLEIELDKLRATFEAAYADLGADAVPAKKLGLPSAKAKPEAHQAFQQILNEYLQAGKLHAHPGDKYGKQAHVPTPWYETTTYAKPFAALVKAARALLGKGDVPVTEVLARLSQTLAEPVPTPVPKSPPLKSPPPTPAAAPIPPVAAPPAAALDLRQAIREAYEHLCLFAEFEDRIVEIPRVYHELQKRHGAIRLEDFHATLRQLSKEQQLELRVLNEVKEAKEPQLAITKDDYLYYYIMWI